MIYRHTQREIDDYYSSPDFNQSAAKAILSMGVEAYVAQQEVLEDEYEEEKSHFTIGKAVDCLLTQGDDCFNEKYHFNDLAKKPAEKPMTIVKMVYDKAMARELEDILSDGNGLRPVELDRNFTTYDVDIWEAMNTVVVPSEDKVGYYMNRAKAYEDDTRIDSLVKDGTCQAYWEDLLKSQGKQIITTGQSQTIRTIVNSFRTHPHTKDLFDESRYEGRDMDLIYQLPLYWDTPVISASVNMVRQRCKALLDMTVIDHRAESILPIDEKTLGDFITRFPYWAKKRRYDLQGAYYTFGLENCLVQISRLIGKDITRYRIQNFGFVVESTMKPGVPLKFPMTDGLLAVGREGDERLEGYKQALEKYVTYRHYNFSVEKVVEDVRGTLWLDESFKTPKTCL